MRGSEELGYAVYPTKLGKYHGAIDTAARRRHADASPRRISCACRILGGWRDGAFLRRRYIRRMAW